MYAAVQTPQNISVMVSDYPNPCILACPCFTKQQPHQTMTSPESDQTLAFLAKHLDAGASSTQIAALVGKVCTEFDLVLAPIVGKHGVAALFTRSLHMSTKSHPWLYGSEGGAGGPPAELDPSALRSAIALQLPPEAAAGGVAVLQNFSELLGKLVGHALTVRLLRTPWLTFMSGTTARDNTQ